MHGWGKPSLRRSWWPEAQVPQGCQSGLHHQVSHWGQQSGGWGWKETGRDGRERWWVSMVVLRPATAAGALVHLTTLRLLSFILEHGPLDCGKSCFRKYLKKGRSHCTCVDYGGHCDASKRAFRRARCPASGSTVCDCLQLWALRGREVTEPNVWLRETSLTAVKGNDLDSYTSTWRDIPHKYWA